MPVDTATQHLQSKREAAKNNRHGRPVLLAIVAILFATLCAPASMSAESVKQIAVPPPPMGWSSWNSFSNTVDSNVVQAQAKALVSSGMQKQGYRFVNIDEGWWLGDRDRQGNIVVDAKQWQALAPGEHSGDMANIVKYIHSLGLKAGIYTDAGESGCSFYGPDLGPKKPHTGSEGHYEQDFLQFAKWGFDYVKVDWCGGSTENLDPAFQYAEIARAIELAEAATGHPLFYSICNWGKKSPWTWAPGVGGIHGDIWRTSGDIVAPIVANSPNRNRKASFTGMLGNFDKGIHPEAQHTGYYNDPDMMVLGMNGLSATQNRVHMSLWAISGAPLLVGADLTKLSRADLATLTNPEVVAVDQDPLGLQCTRVAAPSAGLEVWSKRLTPGDGDSSRRALVMLNRTSAPAPISVAWTALGLESSSATVRDLWSRKNLGSHPSSYTATIPAGNAVMLLIEGREARPTKYSAGKSMVLAGETTTVFRRVKSSGGMTAIEIDYRNGSNQPRLAELRINGQTKTAISFPPTGSANTIGAITIEARLKPAGEDNRLTFSSPCNTMPALDSISVLAGQ